jgi:hypothetical protein
MNAECDSEWESPASGGSPPGRAGGGPGRAPGIHPPGTTQQLASTPEGWQTRVSGRHESIDGAAHGIQRLTVHGAYGQQQLPSMASSRDSPHWTLQQPKRTSPRSNPSDSSLCPLTSRQPKMVSPTPLFGSLFQAQLSDSETI